MAPHPTNGSPPIPPPPKKNPPQDFFVCVWHTVLFPRTPLPPPTAGMAIPAVGVGALAPWEKPPEVPGQNVFCGRGGRVRAATAYGSLGPTSTRAPPKTFGEISPLKFFHKMFPLPSKIPPQIFCTEFFSPLSHESPNNKPPLRTSPQKFPP